MTCAPTTAAQEARAMAPDPESPAIRWTHRTKRSTRADASASIRGVEHPGVTNWC